MHVCDDRLGWLLENKKMVVGKLKNGCWKIKNDISLSYFSSKSDKWYQLLVSADILLISLEPLIGVGNLL